jgi:hypothetical protein
MKLTEVIKVTEGSIGLREKEIELLFIKSEYCNHLERNSTIIDTTSKIISHKVNDSNSRIEFCYSIEHFFNSDICFACRIYLNWKSNIFGFIMNHTKKTYKMFNDNTKGENKFENGLNIYIIINYTDEYEKSIIDYYCLDLIPSKLKESYLKAL